MSLIGEGILVVLINKVLNRYKKAILPVSKNGFFISLTLLKNKAIVGF